MRLEPSPVAAPRVRRRRKDQRPAELAAAALELFVERGYAATRLEDVAQRAGVAKGTVYLYFANKQALFDGVIRQAILPEIERGEQRLGGYRGSTADLLREVLDAWARLLSSDTFSRIPKLMASDADKFPELAQVFHDTVLARGQTLMQKVLARGIARGEFRPVDVKSTVDVLLSAIWMPSIARHSPGFHVEERHDPQAYRAALIDLALKGLEVAVDGAPTVSRYRK